MDELTARFDATVRNMFEPFPKPTRASIEHINKHFGIALPGELISLATDSRSYSSCFAGIGPDFDSIDHIIRINAEWRHVLPSNLAIFTRGFDEMFWCFEIGSSAVQFWCPEALVYPSDDRPIERYDRFNDYLNAAILWQDTSR